MFIEYNNEMRMIVFAEKSIVFARLLHPQLKTKTHMHA